MYTKQEIILRRYREGASQRQISRELSISRKTVKKYLEEYQAIQNSGRCTDEALGIYMSTAPNYDTSKRGKHRLTNEVQAIIDKLLEENDRKLSEGLYKQRLRKCDILEILHDRGYQIGYTTVCNYIREQERLRKEVYIRQENAPGSSCEFDWGGIKLIIAGRKQSVNMSVLTSAYSNYRFGLLAPRQDTLSFMEPHVAFFIHVGGVFHEMVYDNTRVLIARFAGKKQKEPTEALLQLRGHYQFRHRFCNAYRANEKGHVERSVEYVRRKAFGFKHDFASIEEAQKHLDSTLAKVNDTPQQLTGKTARQMLEEEKKSLLPAKTPLACSERETLRVDKYSTISCRTNRYSVPEHLVGRMVDVRIFNNRIDVYDNNERVASHQRDYGNHQWVIAIDHYLDTFKRKPGALKGSVALARSTYLKELYAAHYEDNPRAFIDLLHYCGDHQVSSERLEATVERLINHIAGSISTEKITALLGNKTDDLQPASCSETETRDYAKAQLQQLTQIFR